MMDYPSSSPDPKARPPLHRRRDKPQLSCDACRRRKSKCDRQVPCNTCSKRGLASTCHYPTSRVSKKAGNSRHIHDGATGGLRSRLSDLESRIVALMKVPDAADDAAQPTHEASWCDGSVGSNNLGPVQMSQCTGEDLKTGSLNTSPAASVYVSSAHWVAILEDISELKEQAEFENNTLSTEANDDSLAMDENERPALLSGYRGSFSKEDLLAAVPPRPVVDRLVSEYFNDLDMMPHLSCPHTGTFLREYENFWKNPSDVSLIWLGLLYGMMCLSARFSSTSLPSDPEPEWHDTKASRPLYLDQMVQCLVLGDYTRGGPYVIETLLHYFTIEHIRRPDTEIGIWLLVGVILRLALRMGYHRDPSHFESITPFQGEMRRRVWATLYIIDVMSSIQVGVPRMLQEAQCDTRAPLNLFDADFDETYSELPQPRDDNELTPMFYVLVRYRMVKVMGVLADIINGTQHNPSEAARAEELLQTTYDSLPSILKTAPGSGSIVDSPRILLHRYILAVVFHQARILLHQRCMATVPDDKSTGTIRSLGILVDAAIKVLEHQHLLYAETRPGGRLWSIRWKMSSTMSHEFLMATTVLSKILFSTLGPNPIVEAGSDMYTSIRSVLGRTHEIWLELRGRSKEAKQAADLLTSLFRRLDLSPTSLGLMEEDISILDLESYLGLDIGSLLHGSFL